MMNSIAVQPWMPAPEPFTSQSREILSKHIQHIYCHCRKNPGILNGHRKGGSISMDTCSKEVSIKTEGDILEKVDRLKLALFISQIDGSVIQIWTFRFKEKKTKLITPDFVLQHPPRAFFTGCEFERHFYLKDSDMEIFDKSYWDKWERINPMALHLYIQRIYPQIRNTLARIFDSHKNPMEILDLGAGSGNLADHLLDIIPNAIKQITLIDYSGSAIEIAKARLEKYPGKFTASCQDITKNDFLTEKDSPAFDAVLLSGVVSLEVLTREQSLELLKKCFCQIRKGGYVIVTSFSPAHFYTKDYTLMGYQVLNKSIAIPNGDILDFYVLHKPQI